MHQAFLDMLAQISHYAGLNFAHLPVNLLCEVVQILLKLYDICLPGSIGSAQAVSLVATLHHASHLVLQPVHSFLHSALLVVRLDSPWALAL